MSTTGIRRDKQEIKVSDVVVEKNEKQIVSPVKVVKSASDLNQMRKIQNETQSLRREIASIKESMQTLTANMVEIAKAVNELHARK